MSRDDEPRNDEQGEAEDLAEDLALEQQQSEDVKGGKTQIRKPPSEEFGGSTGMAGTDTTLG